ncbi:Hypothetical predicted protein [Paramuricea clavata]|uniref:Uncharacterized protein n=1 Tax=Paramuricea clavata TaxID=317549 RepID=A0A6S7FMQ3_PARCT|nr:Hypothetical predicted protein [Paramuricea clavata]
MEVKITVTVMEDNKVKRGNSLPLKAFEDGTEVKTILGTTPAEEFTLCRYKEISGFGYSSVPSTSQPMSFPDPSIPSTSSSYCDVQTTTSSSIMKVECPLCFQSFPINQVEVHAGECVGSFGLVEDNSVEVCPVNDISDTELSMNESGSNDSTLLKCISERKENGIKLQMEMIGVTIRSEQDTDTIIQIEC